METISPKILNHIVCKQDREHFSCSKFQQLKGANLNLTKGGPLGPWWQCNPTALSSSLVSEPFWVILPLPSKINSCSQAVSSHGQFLGCGMPDAWQSSFILYSTGSFGLTWKCFALDGWLHLETIHLPSSPIGSPTTLLSSSPQCAVWTGLEFSKASTTSFCLPSSISHSS